MPPGVFTRNRTTTPTASPSPMLYTRANTRFTLSTHALSPLPSFGSAVAGLSHPPPSRLLSTQMSSDFHGGAPHGVIFRSGCGSAFSVTVTSYSFGFVAGTSCVYSISTGPPASGCHVPPAARIICTFSGRLG